MPSGIIVKSVGGNFYIKSSKGIIKASASGKLRDSHITPYAGDNVEYEITEDGLGYIKKIMERKNRLIRPPVCNIDQAIVVTSLVEPNFSQYLLDKLLVQILDNNIKPIIYFSKKDKVKDISQYQKYFDYYRSIGIDTYVGNSKDEKIDENIRKIFKNKVTIVTGQSAAGKSSFINHIDKSLNLKTDDFSKSLGRGKHTTREVEFLEVCDGLVADTPGFSSMDLDITCNRLAQVFPGFKDATSCKFRGCLHESEPGCLIKQQVDENVIMKESYENYLKLQEEIKRRCKK